ncbi:hypothetical protein B0T17DRAFT_545845 [Bombardia bombarda]|uniref:Uncharacterized protein n=1 Tax=Bombardia bombarda TaxID=252184 RepID=A0AA39WAE6_9PEZI|nr:hypothetical protein B0T17DRAFT_545845 [Bombardia bombarda]
MTLCVYLFPIPVSGAKQTPADASSLQPPTFTGSSHPIDFQKQIFLETSTSAMPTLKTKCF